MTTGSSTEGTTPDASSTEGATPDAPSTAVITPDASSTKGANPGARVRPKSKHATVARRLRGLVAAVLVLAILALVGVGTLALVQGTWMVTPVLSGSMRPGLAVGGVVISERVPVDHLVVRDVIVFRDPNDPSKQVVHRIVKLAVGSSGSSLINTQGDANTVRDLWTLTIRGNYAYRVRWSIPLVGYVAIAYQNNHGLFLLGAGIVLILLAVTAFLEPRRRRALHSKS